MKLENQFPTVEQSKKLQDLGVSQIGCFFIQQEEGIYCLIGTVWNKQQYDTRDQDPLFANILQMPKSPNNKQIISHFTVAELSVMLGAYAETYLREDNQWSCGDSKAIYPTQAQASAARLIELLDTGILTAAECNERLLNS